MAARMFGLPTVQCFDANGEQSSLGTKWRDWKEQFENYLVAMAITNDTQKRALLLHLGGDSLYKVFKGLTDTGEDYATAVQKLDEYFMPKKNVRYERYVFKQARQETGESLDQFVTKLRTLSPWYLQHGQMPYHN